MIKYDLLVYLGLLPLLAVIVFSGCRLANLEPSTAFVPVKPRLFERQRRDLNSYPNDIR